MCCDLAALPGEDHHLVVGHLDDFECANPTTRTDAQHYRGQTAAQIRASATWRVQVAGRLPPLPAMSEAQRKSLRALMDRAMPVLP